MKNYSLLIVFCLVSAFGFSQKVTWENDYLKALENVKKTNSVLVFYFMDGENKSLERSIKTNIFKSEEFKKAIGKPIVILKIDESKNNKNKKYNNRLLSTYNLKSQFPSFIGKSLNSNEVTTLVSNIGPKTIANFIIEINNFKK